MWENLADSAVPGLPLTSTSHTQVFQNSPGMTKHSKNNPASSIFSYAEYKKLDYGTKRVRDNLPWNYTGDVHDLDCSND